MPRRSGYGGIGMNTGKSSRGAASPGRGTRGSKGPTRDYETSRVTSFEGQVPKVKKSRGMRARGKV